MSQRYNPEMSRVSIRDHATNPNTDQLYQPLRDTFLNPQNVIRHAPLTPIAARSSLVSKNYRILTPYQLQQMQRNMYIPQGVELEPTHNLQPIRNERFIAVDACERILGPPITPEELDRIRSQGIKKDEVLYEMRNPSQSAFEPINSASAKSLKDQQSKAYGHLPSPVHESEQIQERYNHQQSPPPYQGSEDIQERYVPRNFDAYGKNNWSYKYNLFSIIDEPVNRCRELGIDGCGGCPGNEIVASRNRPQSLAYQ